MKKIIVLATALLVFISPNIYAASKALDAINDACPITGEKISGDPKHMVEYDGKVIGFCCSDCVAKFKADPEKYMAKLKLKPAAKEEPSYGRHMQKEAHSY